MPYTEQELIMLRIWRDKAAGFRWLHYHSMEYYKKINMRFVHTSILLSTIASASGFSFTGSSSGIGSYVGYGIGGVNVIIGLLNSFQRFGKAAEKTEQHSSVAMQYGMLYRMLDTELRLSSQHQRADLIPFARQEMDRLFGHAPDVPQFILHKYDRIFTNVTNKPELCDSMMSNTTETPKSTNDIFQIFSGISKEPEDSPLLSLKSTGLAPIKINATPVLDIIKVDAATQPPLIPTVLAATPPLQVSDLQPSLPSSQ